MIRVIIATSIQLFRSGLAALLAGEVDISVAGASDSGQGLIESAFELRTPDVALIDIELPDSDGFSTAKRLQAGFPGCAVIIMADRTRSGDARRAIAAGAAGLMLKDSSPAELAEAIRRASRGEPVLAAELAFAELCAVQSPLTPRESEVLEALADGKSVSEIAGALCLSPGTVRNYLSRILAKTGARTRVEAVSIASNHGWLMSFTLRRARGLERGRDRCAPP